MKKVVLVDDEILIRESIRDSIDWGKEGFLYSGDAPDGELALPLIEEQAPDILITDIKMPFMNGLELTSIVRQKYPDIRIIVLSGHDDFHYAQTALRLGVEDYCLKPVSAAELIQMLKTVSAKMDEEHRRKQKNTFTPDKLYADLCGGLIGTGAAVEAAAQLGLQLMAPYYAALILSVVPSALNESEIAQSQVQAAELLLANELTRYPELSHFRRSRTETVVLLKDSHPDQIAAKIEMLISGLEQTAPPFGLQLSVSRGGIHERLQGIHLSFQEAENERMLKMLARQNKEALIQASIDHSPDSVLLDRNRLIDFLKLGTPQEAPGFIRQFAAGLHKVSWNSMYAYYLINDITLELVQTAKRTFRSDGNQAELIQELQKKIRRISNVEECLDYWLEVLEQLWVWRSEGSDKYGELIERVRLYIRENYHDDQLSLHEIAKQIGVSSSHLSKVFSQETGQTMTEYLTAARIGRAKELLKTTRCKTFEIAYQVGYSDQHYFSNLFKKVTGMTPMEYRKHGHTGEPAVTIAKGGQI
ncbi:response regulator [Paenibacillus pinistramenti]|uniref:response regulator n=1 Tax=Paenibacillus pinistramenti TaxID=1768003 RepID=UPI001109B66F|nr:response regulator [Paenibacillus pinistramenti]